jgi:hypothetical protein
MPRSLKQLSLVPECKTQLYAMQHEAVNVTSHHWELGLILILHWRGLTCITVYSPRLRDFRAVAFMGKGRSIVTLAIPVADGNASHRPVATIILFQCCPSTIFSLEGTPGMQPGPRIHAT